MGDYWRIPNKRSGSSTWEMDEVMGWYLNPYNKLIPLICISERPVQLLLSIRNDTDADDPDSGNQGSVIAADDERTLFMFIEPLTGWCKAAAKENHSKKTYAELLLEVRKEFSGCEKVRLVSSTLANRGAPAFYEVYQDEPETAERLHRFYEFLATPAKSSWLNMAECELIRMCGECLGGMQDPTLAELNERFAAWTEERRKLKGIKWQFEIANLISRLYPD
ncbi:MAG: hypothetical protein LBT59_10235 [Clostridiales bacterium]|jgi:hypothetical protein|nr:hypothetical protein [Clostridiales bacterium]